MATLYVDTENGNDVNNGTSFALRKRTLTSASSVASPGDIVRVMASPDSTSVGNASWINQGGTVTLASARTLDLYTDGSWTNVGTGTTTNSTAVYRQGSSATAINMISGRTGILAYYDLGASVNISEYSKFSFWMRFTVATTFTENTWFVELCSDAAGTVPVYSYPIPAMNLALGSWIPHLFDNGSSMTTPVRSIVLRTVTTASSTYSIAIDNVFVTNDIWLGSLIRKTTPGELDCWYSIRSITGTNIILDQGPNSMGNIAVRGYYGPTETVATSIRTPIGLAPVAATTTAIFLLGSSGISGSLITYSGGWNRTDMSTQTGDTYMSGRSGIGEGLRTTGRSYIHIERLSFTRCTTGYVLNTGSYINVENCECSNHTSGGLSVSTVGHMGRNIFVNQSAGTPYGMLTAGAKSVLSNITILSCTGSSSIISNQTFLKNIKIYNHLGVGLACSNACNLEVENVIIEDNSTIGISLAGTINSVFRNVQVKNNGTYGITFSNSQENVFIGLESSGNSSATINCLTTSNGRNYFYKCMQSESTFVDAPITYDNSRFISTNHNNTGENFMITDGGTIHSESIIKRGPGISWKLSPTSLARDEMYPLKQRVISLPVKSNVPQVLSVWLYRTSALIIPSMKVAFPEVVGISTPLETTPLIPINTWVEKTISFTPLNDGILVIDIQAYGGTTDSSYWDDFSVISNDRIDTSSGDYPFILSEGYVGDRGITGVGKQTAYLYV